MTTLCPDFKFLFAHPAHLIAFGFGSGLAPKAPGTVGTLLGLPLYWLVVAVAPDLPNRIILLIAAFLIGVWACGRTGRDGSGAERAADRPSSGTAPGCHRAESAC